MFDPIPRHATSAPPAAAFAVALVVGGLVGTATADSSHDSPPDCQCRDPSGQRRDLGTLECVTIGTTRHLVRCEMSTNTPYWRRVPLEGGGCPPAS